MKVYIQVIDRNTGIYQCGCFDEPYVGKHQLDNALAHFGVLYGNVKWGVSYDENVYYGNVEGTSKTVLIYTLNNG